MKTDRFDLKFVLKFLLMPMACLSFGACAPLLQQQDYTTYRELKPQSILVLPPLNESVEVEAPYIYLSTISRPLAECGYYVFPVAVIDAFLKENGLPTPGEMHNISLKKIDDVFGADAVLYVTIEDWGQKYQILSSKTVLKTRARLVHVKSGKTLWTRHQHFIQSSGGGEGGLLGLLVSAAVNQIVNSISDPTYALSKQANDQLVFNAHNGLLRGRYHRLDHKSEMCVH